VLTISGSISVLINWLAQLDRVVLPSLGIALMAELTARCFSRDM
jgi:hypothetical protein